jgi:hypothetical protein
LRTRDERPCRCHTTENAKKFPPSHARPYAWTKHCKGSNEYFDRG